MFERRNCALGITLAISYPAEAIEYCGTIGSQAQRLVDQTLGTREIHVVICQRVSESVHQYRILRPLLQKLLEDLHGLFDATGTFENHCAVVLNGRMLGVLIQSSGQ